VNSQVSYKYILPLVKFSVHLNLLSLIQLKLSSGYLLENEFIDSRNKAIKS